MYKYSSLSKLRAALAIIPVTLVLAACSSTGGEPDTIVIFDEKTNAVTFGSRSQNPELAAKDEFKKADIDKKASIERRRKELGITGGNYNAQGSASYDGLTQAPLGKWEEFQLWKEFEEFRQWKESQVKEQKAN